MSAPGFAIQIRNALGFPLLVYLRYGSRDRGNHIYDNTRRGNPNAFLIWIANPGVDMVDDPVLITDLRTMYQYV